MGEACATVYRQGRLLPKQAVADAENMNLQHHHYDDCDRPPASFTNWSI